MPVKVLFHGDWAGGFSLNLHSHVCAESNGVFGFIFTCYFGCLLVCVLV